MPVFSGANVKITSSDGTEHSITPVTLNVTNVGCYCECSDYQHRFAHFNIQNGCHIGPPPQDYIRKTDTRPEVNPLHVPGLCKHLLKVVETLQEKRILL